MPPVLTLAVPNWNGGTYLQHTLESLARNRPHVRWWFQDSCSTDDSVTLARRFAGLEDHIQVERDSGQTNGLNRAFRAMGGDIVGFLNSDDLLADGAAETVLATFEENPEVDLVYGEVEWIGAQGESQGFHSGRISSLSDVLDIYGVWWNRKQWVQPEVFWRRSLWDRVGQFDESFHLAFDYEYWVRCFQTDVRVKRIPRVLAKFRRHAAQKSTASAKAAAEIRTIVNKALTGASLNPWQALRLRNKLSYDRFHAGEDVGASESFLHNLSRHPAWLALPDVRHRLSRSRKWRLSPR